MRANRKWRVGNRKFNRRVKLVTEQTRKWRRARFLSLYILQSSVCIFQFTTRGQQLHSNTVKTLHLYLGKQISSVIGCSSVTRWMIVDGVFFFFFGPFCLELSWCHCRGAWSVWVGGVYVLFLSYSSFLCSFWKGLYTVGVGGARGRVFSD